MTGVLPQRHSLSSPYTAAVLENRRLTATDWRQDVRHIELDISGYGDADSAFAAGDIVTVFPSNAGSADGRVALSQLAKSIGVSLSDVVLIESRALSGGSLPPHAPSCPRCIAATSSVGADEARHSSSDPCPFDTTRFDIAAAADAFSPAAQLPTGVAITVLQLFSYWLDVLGRPRRSCFEQLSFFASDEEQAEKWVVWYAWPMLRYVDTPPHLISLPFNRLMELSAPEGADLYHSYVSRERRTLVEVRCTARGPMLLASHFSCSYPSRCCLTFPPCASPWRTCWSSCRRWLRATSASRVARRCTPVVPTSAWPLSTIAPVLGGTRSASAGEMGCAAVRSTFELGSPTFADAFACSSWLAGLKPGVDHVPLLLRRGTLRLPDDASIPVVMIGPGTGVAPLRALLQERSARFATSADVDAGGSVDCAPEGAAALGPCALLFGCRHPEKDWLYHVEFEELQVSCALRGGGMRCKYSFTLHPVVSRRHIVALISLRRALASPLRCRRPTSKRLSCVTDDNSFPGSQSAARTSLFAGVQSGCRRT